MINTFQDPYSYAEGRYEADTKLWQEFFQVIDKLYGQSSKLFKELHTFRMAGTVLKWNRTLNMYVLRPVIDVRGELSVWESQQKYEDFRDRHLVPFKNEITKALMELTDYPKWEKIFKSMLGKTLVTFAGEGTLKEISPYGALVEIGGKQEMFNFEECAPF